ARRAAAVRARAVPGREARVRDDAESLVPARGAHAAPVRALAPAGAARAADPVRRRPRSARAEGARGALSLQRACTQSRHDADRGGAGVRIDWRRPVWALHVLIVGLALHNLVMSELWRAGVRGGALTVISAWKDVLLLIALVLVLPRLRLETRADWLAFVFGLFVVVYGLLPQSWLGGGATHKGVLYAARHDLLPVGAYFLGRGLALTGQERSRLCRTVLWTAAGVAAFGLIDVYAVPLSYWRGSAGWFKDQLGLDYGRGVSNLPQNFVYNAGNDVVFRRLTSTFLSPLATAYLLVVALFFIPLRT